MKAKLFYVLLAVVCLTFVVGIGVHLMHKDALAQTTYTISVIELVGNQWVPAEGEPVIFSFWDGDPPLIVEYERVTNELGVVTFVRDDEPWEWWRAEWTQHDNLWLWGGSNPTEESTCYAEFKIQVEQG